MPSGPLHHKNVLNMTNLITSSQKYEAAHNRGQCELKSNTVLPQPSIFIGSSDLRIRFSHSRLLHSLLVPAVEAAVYFGKAESIQDTNYPLQCTVSIWPAACCTVGLSNVPMTLAKILEIRSYQNITETKSATFYYFELFPHIM